MLRFKRKLNPLDQNITDTLNAMKDEKDFVKYDKLLAQLERLYKLKAQDAKKQVSPDTALTVAANLIGIGIVVRHEQFNVITSKAMSFATKLK